MSQANLEVVRRAFEASQRRDAEAAFALYDPRIEIEDEPSTPGTTRYRGVDGLRDWLHRKYGVFTSAEAKVEGVRLPSSGLLQVRLVDAGEPVLL
jgi:ketosteroid isomerase-like protein